MYIHTYIRTFIHICTISAHVSLSDKESQSYTWKCHVHTQVSLDKESVMHYWESEWATSVCIHQQIMWMDISIHNLSHTETIWDLLRFSCLFYPHLVQLSCVTTQTHTPVLFYSWCCMATLATGDTNTKRTRTRTHARTHAHTPPTLFPVSAYNPPHNVVILSYNLRHEIIWDHWSEVKFYHAYTYIYSESTDN